MIYKRRKNGGVYFNVYGCGFIDIDVDT